MNDGQMMDGWMDGWMMGGWYIERGPGHIAFGSKIYFVKTTTVAQYQAKDRVFIVKHHQHHPPHIVACLHIKAMATSRFTFG